MSSCRRTDPLHNGFQQDKTMTRELLPFPPLTTPSPLAFTHLGTYVGMSGDETTDLGDNGQDVRLNVEIAVDTKRIYKPRNIIVGHSHSASG